MLELPEIEQQLHDFPDIRFRLFKLDDFITKLSQVYSTS
jgi:hypothetical protein